MRSSARALSRVLLAVPVCLLAAGAFGAATEVPFELFGRHIFVEVTVNGSEPLDFIFDTGSSSAVICTSTAERIGLKPNRRSSATGAGGRVRAGLSTDNTIRVGKASIEKASLTLIPLEHLGQHIGRRIDGIVGYEVLSRQVVTIDNDRSRLVLATHDEFKPPAGSKSLRFRLRMNIPVVDATIAVADGAKLGGSFLIDTGAGGSLLLNTPFVDDNDLLRRVGRTYRASSAGLTNNANRGYEARVARLDLLGHRFESVPVQLSRSTSGVRAMKAYAGIIGNETLRRFNMTFDYRARRMWVVPSRAYAEPFRIDCAGMRLKLDEAMREVVVHQVIDGSPAAEAGINAGDGIVAIDDTPVDGQPLDELRRKLQAPGTTIRIGVRQPDGSLRDHEILLRPLR